MIYNIKFEYDKINIKPKLNYLNEFTFIPIKYDNKDFVIQTPKLFIPFNIKEFNDKRYLDLSFQNIKNDKNVKLLYENLELIYKKVKEITKKYEIKDFLREFNESFLMRFKVLENTLFFDQNKNKIDLLENLTYGEFIIHLQGLWLINNKLNFDWILLQGKIDMPLYLSEYSFIDYNYGYSKGKGLGKGKSIPPPPPTLPFKPLNSFDNLLRLGISKEAIEHKKKLNNTFDILSVTLQKTPQNIKKAPKDELLEELKKKLQKKII
jgi:hypothetical protein